MKKNFIPAAALAAAVALVSLGGATSCKSDKSASSDSAAVEEAAEVITEEVAAVQPSAGDSIAAVYGPDFFNNPDKKSTTPSPESYMETESGLKYVVVKEGTGARPSATDNVTVHYTGRLTDGTVFDSSVDRGEPATFPLNRVIAGWTEGLQLMQEGGKTIFYIPSELAYGKQGAPGAIPPDAPLIFEVELIKVN